MPGLAMVTGASSGIGEAYARRFAAEGWDLIVVARRVSRLNDLASRLGDLHGTRVEVIESDLTRAEDAARVCRTIEDSPVDILVNNAGLAHYMPFPELPAAKARELLEVNVGAPVLLTRAAVPGMIQRANGAIINVASLLAFSGGLEGRFLPQRAVYAATKSFIVTFSQALAVELLPHGVRVQVVCPGVVRSEFHSRQGMDLSTVPRMEPDDVVKASLSDLSNGVVISVPGLEDTEAIARLKAADAELMSASRVPELAARYGQAEGN